MMMIRRLKLVLLSLGALAWLAACPGEPPAEAECGNGVAEEGEQCDGTDLQGLACRHVTVDATGLLACDSACRYDQSACTLCGDGEVDVEAGEECDCGQDAGDLPAGCGAPNGPDSSCLGDCRLAPPPGSCGNGQLDSPEECDCGSDPLNLPAGCTDVNSDVSATANCDASCLSVWLCSKSLWQECDSTLTPDPCCPDEGGAANQCRPIGFVEYCMRGCTDRNDCFWSNYCASEFGDVCFPELCGPGWDGSVSNNPCALTGGSQGWCWPVVTRSNWDEDFIGLCVESGGLAHGADCPVVAIDVSDRSVDMCADGFCYGTPDSTGVCAQFCDWQADYAVEIYGATNVSQTLPCPADFNCLPETIIDQNGFPGRTPPVPPTGLRQGDIAYCVATTTGDPIDGLDTCSLVSNQLLADGALTCADLKTNGSCSLITYTNSLNVGNGSLVGECLGSVDPPNKAVWELCTAGGGSPDRCPPGSWCVEQDVFDASPMGPTRCVPLCDTSHHDGTLSNCQALGAPATQDGSAVECTTQSILFGPLGPQDIHPTRLGFCALARP